MCWEVLIGFIANIFMTSCIHVLSIGDMKFLLIILILIVLQLLFCVQIARLCMRQLIYIPALCTHCLIACLCSLRRELGEWQWLDSAQDASRHAQEGSLPQL